ncbi:MAG: NUDIX domain-containing protein [Bacteroidota bacterium]
MQVPTDPVAATKLRSATLASEAVERAFGHRVRVRAAGLLFDRAENPERVLLLKHDGLWDDGPFWSPPGGAIEFGEALSEGVRREFEEEASLSVRVGEPAYVLDFVRPPLHAVSFYFRVYPADGDYADLESRLRTGTDPELLADGVQLLQEARFIPLDNLQHLRLYPEGLAERLPHDARAGFPDGTQYIGTLR